MKQRGERIDEFGFTDQALRDADRIMQVYGENAFPEARYRLTVARNCHDQQAIEHWSAVSDVIFRRRFGTAPKLIESMLFRN